MNTKIKFRFSIINIAIFWIVFYAFFRSIILTCIGSFSSYMLLLSMLIIWIYAFFIYKYVVKKHVIKLWFLWLLFCVIILLHNQKYIKVGFSFTTLVTVGGIMTALALNGTKIEWERIALKTLDIAVKFHIVATLFFGVLPNVYLHTVCKMFDSGTQEILIEQVAAKCVPGITSHYSTNGIYLAIALMWFGSQYLMNKECQNRYSKIWFCLSIIALLITGKRAHLIFSVLSIMISYFICSNEKVNSKLMKGIFATVILLFIIVIIIDFVPALSVTFSRIIDLANTSDITNGRYYFYSFALQWFKENPILGIGWDGFKYRLNITTGAYVGKFEYMSAHNVYLQVLCELGIVGFSVFCLKMIQDLFLCFKKIKWRKLDRSYCKSILSYSFCMHLFFVMYCMTGNPLYDAEIFIPYIMSMALLYKYSRKNGENREA